MEIRAFRKEDQPKFKALVIETHEEFGFPYDHKLDYDLDNPHEEYIQTGGQVFLLCDKEEIVGSCALKPLGNGAAEIKRMYLRPEYRGRCYGSQLLETAVDFAKERRYQRLVLDTHTSQQRAVRLYTRFGFSETRREGNKIFFEKIL